MWTQRTVHTFEGEEVAGDETRVAVGFGGGTGIPL